MAEEEDVGVEVEAEEVVAGIEAMSVGSEDDEDEVVDGKIVVRLRGDRKRGIVETGEGERVEEVGEGSLVRAIPVSPRSGVQGLVAGRRIPSRPSAYFSRERGGMGMGWGGEGVAQYQLDYIGRGNVLMPRPGPGTRFGRGENVWQW